MRAKRLQLLEMLRKGPEESQRVIGQLIQIFPQISSQQLKSDIFDGTVSLREYMGQFELIARANGWDDNLKAVFLAANLRGRARSVLDNW